MASTPKEVFQLLPPVVSVARLSHFAPLFHHIYLTGNFSSEGRYIGTLTGAAPLPLGADTADTLKVLSATSGGRAYPIAYCPVQEAMMSTITTMTLEGRTALVTGASRGIGQAIATRLAEAGSDVAVGFGQQSAAAEVQTERIRQLGRRAVAVGADLRDPAQVMRMVERAEAALGVIDILVSNAGIGPQQALEEITLEEWDQVMQVNLRPAFLLAQRLTPAMRQRGWGRVILVSSVAAFTGGIVGPHYATSKAALLGLTHALAGPLAPFGVTVNAVAPALIDTEMLPADPEGQQRIARRIPVGRLGRAEEVAEVVLALVANPYMTSQTLLVDGGVYPR